jgi:hypothetical protein
VAVCCDVQGCIVCTTTAGKSVKAARNALWLGGWARRKKQDICPMHNPKRDDYEQRRTSMEYRRRQPPSSGTHTQTARS